MMASGRWVDEMIAQTGVAYGLVAGGAWGVILYASKRHFPEFHSATFMSIVFGVAAVWYSPVAFTGGVVHDLSTATSFERVGMVALTIVLLTAGLYVMFLAISIGDVSYVAPVSKITPVFVVPIEVALLDEHLAPLQVAGVVVATTAVYLANYEGGGLFVPLRRAVTYRPGRLALASALILAFLNVSQRFVLQELAVSPTTWIGIKLAGASLLLAPLGWNRTDRDAVVVALPKFALLGLLLAFGEHFLGIAFATIPASIASPLVATQSIVAVLLGGVLLREGNFAVRLLAAVVAVAGIGLITVP